MKIAVKTKITEWGTVGDKEKISFELLDFSPDQVADIDRLIRNNNEDPVRMTIEVIQKKLEILPIESQVRLVSMNCMSGGQKLKIADFKSPDTRATALKRMVNTDTQIILTIEAVQGNLFNDTDRPDQQSAASAADDEKTEDFKVNDNGVIENPKQITVNFPKTYKTTCVISYAFSDEWYSGYDINVSHFGEYLPVSKNHLRFDTLEEALENAQLQVCEWIENQPKYKYKKQAQTAVIKAVEKFLENDGGRKTEN